MFAPSITVESVKSTQCGAQALGVSTAKLITGFGFIKCVTVALSRGQSPVALVFNVNITFLAATSAAVGV